MWTPTQEVILRINYDYEPWEKIAQVVGKKTHTVKMQAYRKGLYKRGSHEQTRARKQAQEKIKQEHQNRLLSMTEDELREYL